MNLIDLTRRISQVASCIGIAVLLPTQTGLAQVEIDDSLAWSNFRNALIDQEDPGRNRNGGGRPGDICLVTDYATSVQVWHLQPIYLWQGTERPMAIRSVGEPADLLVTDVSTEPTTALNLAQNLETELEPGESYTWELSDAIDPDQVLMVIPFQVMATTERDQLTLALTQLVEDLENQGASNEVIALAKADFFLEQGLTMDALQVMFEVEAPSDALIASRVEIVETWCD